MRLIKKLTEHSLGGAEALAAIPGSIGGGIRMNAGAQGLETSEFVTAVHGITRQGKERTYQKNEIHWRYRGCNLPDDTLLHPST